MNHPECVGYPEKRGRFSYPFRPFSALEISYNAANRLSSGNYAFFRENGQKRRYGGSEKCIN